MLLLDKEESLHTFIRVHFLGQSYRTPDISSGITQAALLADKDSS